MYTDPSRARVTTSIIYCRLREDIQLLAQNQRNMMDRFKRDVSSLKSILQQIAMHTMSGTKHFYFWHFILKL